MTETRARLPMLSAVAVRLLAAALMVVALAPATALAAAVPTTASSLDVEIWPEGDQHQTSIISVAEVRESVALPTKVRIPLPADAQIMWAGQILGTDISGDIPEKPVPKEGTGGQYVELTADKSRRVQYEAAVGPTTANGNAHTSTLNWVQSTDAGPVRFAVRLPLGATNVSIKPAPVGDPERNEQLQQMLYVLAPVTLKAGATAKVTVTYDLTPGAAGSGSGAAATGAPPAAAATGTTTWMVPLVIVLLALVPIVYMVLRRRGAAAAGGDDHDEEGADAEGGAHDEDEDDGESGTDRDDGEVPPPPPPPAR